MLNERCRLNTLYYFRQPIYLLAIKRCRYLFKMRLMKTTPYLPLISAESLPIPSMIPMIRSTTPDVLLVHIRLARCRHGWTALASSNRAVCPLTFQLR